MTRGARKEQIYPENISVYECYAFYFDLSLKKLKNINFERERVDQWSVIFLELLTIKWKGF